MQSHTQSTPSARLSPRSMLSMLSNDKAVSFQYFTTLNTTNISRHSLRFRWLSALFILMFYDFSLRVHLIGSQVGLEALRCTRIRWHTSCAMAVA